jgi:O-antigen/teichoic acid export membrane protein
MDTRRYVRNVSFNQANLVVGVLIGFFMSPFIVRQLGDTGNGYWSLVVTITAYFGYFDLGIQSGVSHYVTRHLADGDRKRFNDKFNSALTVLLGIGLLAAVASLGMAAFLPDLFRVPPEAEEPVRTALLLIGLVTAAKFPFAAFQAVLVGAQRYDLMSGTALVVRVINATLVFYALSTHRHLEVLAVIVACTQLLEGLVLMFFALRVVPPLRVRLLHFRWREFRELLDYGFFNFLINISSQFGAAFGTLIIARQIDAAAVTYYTISLDVIPYMASVIYALSLPLLQILIPMDVSGDIAALRNLFLKGSRYLGALTCLMTANLLLVGPDFLGRWMGSKYLEPEPYGSSGVVMIILTCASAVSLMATLAETVLFGRRKNRIFAVVIILETLLIVALSLVFVKHWGIVGVAVAVLVPDLLARGFVLNALAAYYAETTYRRFASYALLPNLAVLAAVCLIAGPVLHRWPPSGYPSILLSFALVSALHAALVASFIIERDDRLRLVQFIAQSIARLRGSASKLGGRA